MSEEIHLPIERSGLVFFEQTLQASTPNVLTTQDRKIKIPVQLLSEVFLLGDITSDYSGASIAVAKRGYLRNDGLSSSG